MHSAYRAVSVQLTTVAFGALISLFWLGVEIAQAFFFGGAVAIANTLFLIWCMRAGKNQPIREARRELAWLVRFSLERFFMVALLMVAGLGWLKLIPAPLIIGFVLGQMALVVSTIFSGIEN